ncbi:MAG: putative peptide zinc metalloprotease protein, partial [Solirubrobacteraceae bacterium]|nr:putative peptide zinc metalloprotease protein [Solirubrobacteraceae bacterium]
EGSGLRESPYLVRRGDGQVVQLTRLLYLLLEEAEPNRDLAVVGNRAGKQLDLRITPDQVRHVFDRKLAPLGLAVDSKGFVAEPSPVEDVMALRMRVGLVPPNVVGAVAGVLRHLFHVPAVALVLGALLAGDILLLVHGGFGAGLNHVIQSPELTLLLFALTWLSLAFRELGHAAACRFGGGRPGRIGAGIYIVWPVFFSDVTDSYRFGRRARLRVDLGGVYFNGIFALAVMALYAATGFAPLVLVVAAQHALVVNQFIPWIKLDGYYVVSDLIGVSDLYSRIGPTLRSLRPGRETDVRVRQLKPWARAAVTGWVLTTVVALSGALVWMLASAPEYLERAWASIRAQTGAITGGAGLVETVAGALSVGLLILPVLGLIVTYVLLCRQAGTLLAIARCRRVLSAAATTTDD